MRKNLTPYWIKKYSNQHWNWDKIDRTNKHILTIIKNNKLESKIPSIWTYVSCNENLTLEWLLQNYNKRWYWSYISRNEKVSLAWLEYFPTKDWNWSLIKLSSKDIRERKYREYLAAYRIQQWWQKLKHDPKTSVGYKYMNQLYDENFS